MKLTACSEVRNKESWFGIAEEDSNETHMQERVGEDGNRKSETRNKEDLFRNLLEKHRRHSSEGRNASRLTIRRRMAKGWLFARLTLAVQVSMCIPSTH